MDQNQDLENIGVLPGELDRAITRLRNNNWEGLEPAKRAFAMAYVQSFSHHEAAVSIGKPSVGLKYIRDPLVRAFISDIQEEYSKISLINKHLVEAKMLETLEKLEGKADVPMVTGQGATFSGKKFHSGETVSLLKEMARMSGMSDDPKGKTSPVNIQINMGDLTGEAPGVTVNG